MGSISCIVLKEMYLAQRAFDELKAYRSQQHTCTYLTAHTFETLRTPS